MVKQRITRNMSSKTIQKRHDDQHNAAHEIVRLERKISNYEKQESALMKMLDVVRDQTTKIEVEGLQLAANLRQKDLEDDSKTVDITKSHFPHEICQFENIEEINKSVLQLENHLNEMFEDTFCGETEEEDELKFPYFEEFEQ